MPSLSIIIPTLNDRPSLEALLDDLVHQQGVHFEVILCDGGSTDGSAHVGQRREDPFPLKLITTSPGRGRQLNRGAEQAANDLLVFLHADSRLPSKTCLADGFAQLTEQWDKAGNHRVAGHLSLSFRTQKEKGLSWFFYESKARTNRPLTLHGDQSFWVDRSFFYACGCFDSDLTVLEDTRFAEKLRCKGRWHLLTPTIQTSARRFDTEGLLRRQILNALIVNFDQIGWDAFFQAAPDIYRQQDKSTHLDLWPFWCLVQRLLHQLPAKQQARRWFATGRFVCRQAWQIAFFFDVRRRYRQAAHRPTGEAGPFTRWMDRWWSRIVDHPVGHGLTSFLVLFWFYLLFASFWLRRKRRGG